MSNEWCLACYSQKLIFFLFGNQDKDKHEPCKGSDKDKIQTTFLKSDIYDLF